jgi:hypothetical protein
MANVPEGRGRDRGQGALRMQVKGKQGPEKAFGISLRRERRVSPVQNQAALEL